MTIAETQILRPLDISILKNNSLDKMAPAPLIHHHDHATHIGHQIPLHSRALTKDAFRSRIESIDTDICESNAESAFFVSDLGEVYRQYCRWVRNLPRVEPFYAVKCNPDPQVIKLLARLGTGFDCASKAEIQQVLNTGVEPHRIIYANPCKAASYIRYAASENVRATTFDNAEELYKIANFFPEAELYLRILTDDSKALCQLGLKYGAPLHTTKGLLKLARQLGLNVVGVSFHVGSGASDPFAFVDAVNRARVVFNEGETLGFEMHTLDIGGGFGHGNFEKFASVVGPAIDDHFASHVRVIAEPGRYFVAAAFTLATNVIARRTVHPYSEDGPSPGDIVNHFMYYVNDGVYGSFNCIMFDHQHPVAKILSHKGKLYYNTLTGLGKQSVRCSIWGPTCDGLDCITAETHLPFVLEVGDWLYFEEMGAYTRCAASKFNGYNLSEVIYVCSERVAADMIDFD